MYNAIILTNAPVSIEDEQILRNTNIHKFAINAHAEDLKPTFRICSDYGVIGDLLQNFNQKIISIREFAPNERLIYAGEISFKGSTMVACIEYLISRFYKDILIIGDNTVHQDFFKDRINNEIGKILEQNPDVKIYQYSNGNFNLPVLSVKQFINEREVLRT